MHVPSCQIQKIAGSACSRNIGNVFPATAGWRSRHASRHVHHACANKRFPLKSMAGKTFPVFPAHAQPTIIRMRKKGTFVNISAIFLDINLLWTRALSYNSNLTLSQAFQPITAQLSKKAALPLTKILATASCIGRKTGLSVAIWRLGSGSVLVQVMAVCDFWWLQIRWNTQFDSNRFPLFSVDDRKPQIWIIPVQIWEVSRGSTGKGNTHDPKLISFLFRWGRVTHICIVKLTIIVSDNGLSPERRQAIIWTNAGILLIGPLGTNFSEILIVIQTFSLKKIGLKLSSAKCSFRLGLSVLTLSLVYTKSHYNDITITPWPFKSPATRLFIQYRTQLSDKENTTVSHHGPSVRGIRRWPVHSHRKRPATRKAIRCNDDIMENTYLKDDHTDTNPYDDTEVLLDEFPERVIASLKITRTNNHWTTC